MNIKIYRAADSFLYLPAYIAEDLEILQTELAKIEKYRTTQFNVEFVNLDANNSTGDEKAIEEMLKNSSDNTIAIAIGSPVAFLNPNMSENVKKNIVVVGAIIDKLTFWAVNNHGNTQKYDSIEEMGGNGFSKVVYPEEKFVTGYYLGKKIRNEINIDEFHNVNFGDEIKIIKAHGSKENKSIAITANIATLAKETKDICSKETERKFCPKETEGISMIPNASSESSIGLYINHYFSKSQGEFLTTGIVTSRNSCKNFPEVIEKIIESIQKSISILYSSDKTARKICAVIAKAKFGDKFCEVTGDDCQTIKKIIQMMHDEKFYPGDLNVSKKAWDKAVIALAKTKDWKENKKNEKNVKEILSKSFYNFVDNKFVLESERHIAEQFGIDPNTFKSISIIKYKFKKIFELILGMLKKHLTVFLCMLFTLIIFVLLFIYQHTGKISEKDVIFLFLGPILGTIAGKLVGGKV
ncbi:MAG: hypothetical protein LBC85_10050 [Fibromonadaceae bacterium]|nr:hypothetical protein [Fibromonadaceae bacterium]